MSAEILTKVVEVSKSMNLIDLNGSKKNFKSEIHVKAKRPIDRYMIAIVSQNDLDNEDEKKINYVGCDDNGEFHHTFTYKQNVYLNHYLVLKKKIEDNSFSPIICDVELKLTEIEMTELKPYHPPPPPPPPPPAALSPVAAH